MTVFRGAMSIENFNFITPKESSRPTNNIKKDFFQLFEAKMQCSNDSNVRSLSKNNNNIDYTQNKIINSSNNSLEIHNNSYELKNDLVKECKIKGKESEGEDKINLQIDRRNKEILLEELPGETYQQYQSIIQLTQPIEELIQILLHLGYITKNEAEGIMDELFAIKELDKTTLNLKDVLQQLYMQVEEKILQINDTKEIGDLQNLIKSLLELPKPINQHHQEVHIKLKEDKSIPNIEGYNKDDIEVSSMRIKIHETPIEKQSFSKLFLDKDTSFKREDSIITNNRYAGFYSEESFIEVESVKNIATTLKNDIGIQGLTLEEIHIKNLTEEFINKVEGIYRLGKNQLKLQLIPENLGKLSISLISEGQMIRAKVYVETLQVKEILESSLNQFKESMREKGVNITSIEVSIGKESEAFLGNRNFPQQKLKFKGVTSALHKGLTTIEEIDSAISLNPYLAREGFDKLG